jgi:hypothetical protein
MNFKYKKNITFVTVKIFMQYCYYYTHKDLYINQI